MSGRIKSRIQKLLNDLDVDADVGADPGPSGEGQSRPGTSATDALSDVMHGALDVDYSVGTSSDGEDGPGGQRGGVSYDRAMLLERRVMQLLSDNKSLAQQYEVFAARKNAEVAELQHTLSSVVRDVAARQQDVEASAPILKLRLEEFREKLADLRVSDAQYSELKRLPKDNRHPLDEVKIAVHESVAELKKENERLRLATSSAQEAAARAEEASVRAKLELGRAQANLGEKERDVETLATSMQARIDRLASELEQAMVRAELNSAKGSMYDDLKAKLDAAIADNQRLQVIEATYKKLEAQSTELQLYAKQKEHTFEMLMMDKAYLTKQSELLSEQQRKLEAELELREKKINELSRHKSELFEKLMASESLKSRQEEGRLAKELGALQQRTHADMERIRLETAEAYEREARLLRELRDRAQEEASRAKVAHAELADVHEKQQLAHSEIVKRLEQQVVELQTELKHKSFELSHLKVVVGEKEGLLGRANMQTELLNDKLEVLMDKYRTLEVEHSSSVNKALRAAADTIVMGGRGGDGAGSGSSGAGPSGMTAQQQVELITLRQERDSLVRDVAQLRERLASAHDTLRLASQPHGFLLKQLDELKGRAGDAEKRVAAMQATLAAKDEEVSALASQNTTLKSDLDALLAQRLQLDAMKQLVVKALAGGLPGSTTAAVASAGVVRRAPGGLPGVGGAANATTIITGEGL